MIEGQITTDITKQKGTPIHIAIGIPVSSLYSTTLLAALNARRGWVPLKGPHEVRLPGHAPSSGGNREQNSGAGEKSLVMQFRPNTAIETTSTSYDFPSNQSQNSVFPSQNVVLTSSVEFSPPPSAGFAANNQNPRNPNRQNQLRSRSHQQEDLRYNIGLVDERYLHDRQDSNGFEQFEMSFGLNDANSGLEKSSTSSKKPEGLV